MYRRGRRRTKRRRPHIFWSFRRHVLWSALQLRQRKSSNGHEKYLITHSAAQEIEGRKRRVKRSINAKERRYTLPGTACKLWKVGGINKWAIHKWQIVDLLVSLSAFHATCNYCSSSQIEKGKTSFPVKYTPLNLEVYTPISSKSGHMSFLWRFSC